MNVEAMLRKVKVDDCGNVYNVDGLAQLTEELRNPALTTPLCRAAGVRVPCTTTTWRKRVAAAELLRRAIHTRDAWLNIFLDIREVIKAGTLNALATDKDHRVQYKIAEVINKIAEHELPGWPELRHFIATILETTYDDGQEAPLLVSLALGCYIRSESDHWARCLTFLRDVLAETLNKVEQPNSLFADETMGIFQFYLKFARRYPIILELYLHSMPRLMTIIITLLDHKMLSASIALPLVKPWMGLLVEQPDDEFMPHLDSLVFGCRRYLDDENLGEGEKEIANDFKRAIQQRKTALPPGNDSGDASERIR